jgi:DNA-binding Lrp family transcriptional regulator
MDDRDRRILEELKADAWLSYTALAERVHPLVEAAHYVTGDMDVVLTLRVTGVPEYAQFVEERLNDDARVRRFRTLTSIRQLV